MVHFYKQHLGFKRIVGEFGMGRQLSFCEKEDVHKFRNLLDSRCLRWISRF